MKNVIGILGAGADGGTFLEWSMLYLSGTTQYYCIPVDRREDLINEPALLTLLNNPISNIGNAHNHEKTHPTLSLISGVIDKFKELDANLHVFYACNKTIGKGQDYSITESGIEFDRIVRNNPDVNFIYITIERAFLLEFFDRYINKVLPVHVAPVRRNLTYLTLTSRRDKRMFALERMLPKFNGFLAELELLPVPQYANCYSISASKIYYALNNDIDKIFKQFNLDMTNRDSWQAVYQQWQVANGVPFFKNLDCIVDSIVAGTDLDLSPYQLTITNECVIICKLAQRKIFIKHDHLEVMPVNTCDWHKLISSR
jgi:hypothetical protein